ncbi:hypothetical protein SEA_CREWMATE_64 [Arthrobacter phage Crewmate]|uniref:Uncharacterized protein n=1 Tax=Arthrobacter phage Crewmate TaxID=2832317 RepID=A0AA48Y3K2_9CAUD|nr:hypothetical protein PQE17_gp64 [Arthrobacter phage Crewmate]UIW13315.1 hypothetical protein SEA_CREWMATE_64 [Arthrobacter phage Crewmate]
MAAHVEYSNFSSGYAWAKCNECGWRGTKHIGAGKLSNDQARKEAAAHDVEHAKEEALMERSSKARAEALADPAEREAAAKWWVAKNDVPSMTGADSIAFVQEYRLAGMGGLVEEFRHSQTHEGDTCEHGLSAWLCEGPMHYPADRPF